jgi:hypothetical protein
VIFTPVDELIFSLAIRDIIPSAVFLSGHRLRGHDDVQTDWTKISSMSIVIAVPETAGWRPQFESNAAYLDWTTIKNLPSRAAHFLRSEWDWDTTGRQPKAHQLAYEPPTLFEGSVGAKFDPDHPLAPELTAFMKQLFRIISRIGTNRFKTGTPRSNEIERGTDVLRMRDAKRRNLWLGHHALEWCQKSPRRMLGGAYRPCDDWRLPRTDWYRLLRRRVEQTYGIGIGEPPVSPS